MLEHGAGQSLDIMSRYCKFFLSLRTSPCKEVSTLANLVVRDVRSVTGRNIKLISELSGSNLWSDSPGKVRAGLMEAEIIVNFEKEDSWRVNYLGSLLRHRQAWQYRGDKEQVAKVQSLIDSLCVN